MSRLTVGNVFKVAVALFFFPFLPLLVLMIGVRRKNRKVILEGAAYIAVFLVAISAVGGDGAFATLSAFAVLGIWPVSAMRSYMLRDLWLHRRVRGQRPEVITQPHPPRTPAYQPSPAAASITPPTADLSPALAWVASLAKQNKNRLPAESYVAVLETCQTLDAVIDAEARQPLADAAFEYELAAIVREYLPAVLQGYLAIPPGMLDNRQPNGRTPNEELVEQLQLLSGQAESLHASRHRHTSAELTSTGNFLRERFGHHQQGGFDFGVK